MANTDRSRRMPAVRALLMDVFFAGAVLCACALLHHVLPARLAVPASDAHAQAINAGQASSESASIPEPSASEEFAFANVFSSGATVTTGTSYRSRNLSVTLRSYTLDSAVYHVEDIYVRDIACLRTAFAGGNYGKGLRAHPLKLAVAEDAVCAINGDYYGASPDNGVVIRNGTLYRDRPTGDVLVLYQDGSMRSFLKSDFDGKTEIGRGAYQAWCFGPSLLDPDGRAMTEFTCGSHIARANPRTVIGYYEPGHYCFLAVDGRSKVSDGMSLAELSALCESLGLALAYNLDGGRTSVMTFGDAVVNNPDAGGRSSSDIIYIREIGEPA